jgi:hypothetical protein
MAAVRSLPRPRRDHRQPQPQQRRRRRRVAAVADDEDEQLPAVQSLLGPAGTNYFYTETPRWLGTLGIPSGTTTNTTREDRNQITDDYHRYATWATAPLLIQQQQSRSPSSSYSIDDGCWVVAATTDGTILFWWLLHDTNTTASGWNSNGAAIALPTQSVSVMISSDYYYHQHKDDDDDDDNDWNDDDDESTFDRVIRLIYLEQRSLLLAVTILGNVLELRTHQPNDQNKNKNNNDDETTTAAVVPSTWTVQNKYSTGYNTDGGGSDDDDAMNIRHAIVWSNDNCDDDGSSTEQPQHTAPRVVLVYTTDSHIMAWEVPTGTGSGTGSSDTGTLKNKKNKKKKALSLLWKHAVEDITGLEVLGSHLLVLAHHNGRSVQVLDLSILLSLSSSSLENNNEMTTIFMDATVLARPGYELETATTTNMIEGPTILYRRPTLTTTADDPNCVVIAFADGRCAVLAVMDNDDDGNGNGHGNIVEWGVLGAPVTLPVPAVGIGTNRWGDIIHCLPAGSTIVQDITGGDARSTAAWMLPVGTFSSGEQHQPQQVEEDIMVPVEGFFASANGYCVYQWPNGVMDVYAVQTSTEQLLLQALVDAGVARDLVQWLCQSSSDDHQTTMLPVATTTMEQHLARVRTELLSMTTPAATDRPMEELFVVAPTLRRCLLLLTQSE